MKTVSKGKRLTLLAAGALLAVAGIQVAVNWSKLMEHYRFWRDFESIGDNEQGYPEYRQRQTGIVFVSLPGGTFMMGSPQDEEGRDEDEAIHEATVTPFLIAKYEVTQTQWELVMGSNPSDRRGPTHPVDTISWLDCQRFCDRTGLSLPTETQWEYACRAGTRGRFAGNGELADMAWCHAAEEDKTNAAVDEDGTRAVGSKLPNAFGIYDMHGNVLEWCRDTYVEDFYSTPNASGVDPFCDYDPDERRVWRGGSWVSSDEQCRSAERDFYPSDWIGFSNVGFRPCFVR